MANLGIGQMSNLGLVHQANEFGKLMSIFWYQERASPPSRLNVDPGLYESVATAEPGYGLLDIVESLALEMNAKEVETAV
jgi:hypothetical protein